MEFTGEGLSSLSVSDRLCIANMAIEAGAKNGIFPVDEKTIAFLKERGVTRPWTAIEADEDAQYAQTITIDLSKLVPVVAYPHSPENTHPAAEGKDIATQCKSVLEQIDALLSEAGTDKSRLLTAQIWLTDIEGDFVTMNGVWEEWLDPNGIPTRATVEAKLARPTINIEIQVTAAK